MSFDIAGLNRADGMYLNDSYSALSLSQYKSNDSYTLKKVTLLSITWYNS